MIMETDCIQCVAFKLTATLRPVPLLPSSLHVSTFISGLQHCWVLNHSDIPETKNKTIQKNGNFQIHRSTRTPLVQLTFKKNGVGRGYLFFQKKHVNRHILLYVIYFSIMLMPQTLFCRQIVLISYRLSDAPSSHRGSYVCFNLHRSN